ncbi:hypothetical protein NDU88_007255 [Pleurodeles waltl]|uniref:Uncharacterized protein n=1 Tax=Pleurodeles waltl TaxID=8319 RepID=A0AAV7SRY4_PLEWA|nr:hypothetical protein NDU88_007255 [Pleurodeles waltl]
MRSGKTSYLLKSWHRVLAHWRDFQIAVNLSKGRELLEPKSPAPSSLPDKDTVLNKHERKETMQKPTYHRLLCEPYYKIDRYGQKFSHLKGCGIKCTIQ